MYFKAQFLNGLTNHSVFEEIEISNITGKEILIFNNYEFEIERNNESEIIGITFCNQCVNTYGIEAEFMNLISKLLKKDEIVKLFDSNGLVEELCWDEIQDYCN